MLAIGARLLAALSYPRAVDEYVELALPLHSSRDVRARVVDVRRETADVTTLCLEPNTLWKGHRAGQHVALAVEIAGVRKTRFFSIASAEKGRGGAIEITIKACEGGLVTPHLVFGSRRGSVVTLSQAKGDFVLPESLPERLLFVSGGSGITPVMSMLRTLLQRGEGRQIVFVHHARTLNDVIFGEELARIEREAPPGVRIHVRAGPFEAAALAGLVPDFEDVDTWACGPEPFLASVNDAFAARGAAGRVRTERFSIADTGGAGGEVVFARSERRASGDGSLLVMAERTGLSPQSGCRMGICRTCTCRKLSGVTRDVRTGELSTESDVDIQLCVSAPVGAVTLDL